MSKVHKLTPRKSLKAPHSSLQDALFMYASGGDGISAIQVRGWPALVAKVQEEVAGDDWAETLSDLEEWQTDGWGLPTHYSCDLGGDWIAIYRITEEVKETQP